MWPGSRNGLGKHKAKEQVDGPRGEGAQGRCSPHSWAAQCSIAPCAVWVCSLEQVLPGPVIVTQAFTLGSYWLLYMIFKLPHNFVGRLQVWERDTNT